MKRYIKASKDDSSVSLLTERIVDCLAEDSDKFEDYDEDRQHAYGLSSECAKKILDKYPEMDIESADIYVAGEPMYVDCTELQVGDAYCFLVWEDDDVYVDYIPEIYVDSGIADESGPL